MSNAEPPRYRFVLLVEGDADVANAALSNIGQITDVQQVPSLGGASVPRTNFDDLFTGEHPEDASKGPANAPASPTPGEAVQMLAFVRAVTAAASGDSNDEELDAYRDALSHALIQHYPQLVHLFP